jgi:T4 RnlA family RNA ligase
MATTFSIDLYKDLMALCNDTSNAFYFSDRVTDTHVFRVFSYRLASWSDFLLPNAKNCRGTMFDITNEDNITLVSLPPEKFFNAAEGNVDHSQHPIGEILTKMDGSLISTYSLYANAQHTDSYGAILRANMIFGIKSKTSINSEQSTAALEYLTLPEHNDLFQILRVFDDLGYTVNMEWTSPKNRIVIPYQEDKLTILSARDILTGLSYFGDELKSLIKSYGGSSDFKYDKVITYLVDSKKNRHVL